MLRFRKTSMTIRRITAQRNSEVAQFALRGRPAVEAGNRLHCHKGMFGWQAVIFLARLLRRSWSAASQAAKGRARGAAFQACNAGGLQYRRPALHVLGAARLILQTMVTLLAVSGIFGFVAMAGAQEIPLEKCDALPIVDVLVAGEHTTLLVDTAATSMLNLKSFSAGRDKDIRVTSWSGTLATSAKEITLGEVVIGSTKLVGLQLPAIDLSSIGEACGRKIDGILGADLIAKLGATIDLKKQSMHVTTADEERAVRLAAEMHREMHGCLDAFNHSDEAEFGECLDPKIVLFTMNTELYGRKQVVGYFRDKYFHHTPPAKLELHESAFHAVGDAVWYEYEFTIYSALGLLRGRGVAMCQKSDGRWRMASMHHSVEKLEPAVAAR